MALGIAFEGCACKSAYQVGVIERLSELGLHFDAAAGASSGAIVALSVAMGRVDVLRETWEDVTLRHEPFEWARLLRLGWPGRMSHVLRDAIRGWVGGLRLPEVPRPLAIPITVPGRGRRVLTRADDVDVVDAIHASCFIPGPYSRLPIIQGLPAVDGAWDVRVPAADVLSAEVRHAIAVTANEAGILAGGVVWQRALAWPEGVAVLRPVAPVPIKGFDFDPERTRQSIEVGRLSAEAFVRAHGPWLARALRGRADEGSCRL